MKLFLIVLIAIASSNMLKSTLNRDSLTRPDSVQIFYTPEYLYGYSGGQNWWIKSQKGIALSIKTPAPKSIGKVIMVLYPDEVALSNYVVEPDDDITFEIKDGEVHFNGKGKVKYECRYLLEKKIEEFRNSQMELDNRNELYTSIDSICVVFRRYTSHLSDLHTILTRFQSKISHEAFRLMGGDLDGYVRSQWQGRMESIYYFSPTEKFKRQVMDSLEKYVIPIDSNNELGLAASRYYIDCETSKAKLKLSFLNQNRPYPFEQMYSYIADNYNGILRDKLWLLCLAWPDMRLGTITPRSGVFDSCVADAANRVKSRAVKEALENLTKIKKGSHFFSFSLPDSTGKRWALTDFKGKVVLIDVWGTGCSGCISFAKGIEYFVKPHLPDSLFTVVSINIDKSKDNWIRSLNSGKYFQKHSINLFAGGLDVTLPLVRYYDIQALPFTVLVDQQGKVICKLTNSDKPEDIISLVNNVLSNPTR